MKELFLVSYNASNKPVKYSKLFSEGSKCLLEKVILLNWIFVYTQLLGVFFFGYLKKNAFVFERCILISDSNSGRLI